MDTKREDEDSYPLLADNDIEQLSTAAGPTSSFSQYAVSGKLMKFTWTLIHLSLIGTYTAAFFFLALKTRFQSHPVAQQLPLPARPALTPKVRYFPTLLENNPFAGAPRAELEVAWHTLLQNDNILVPRKELDALSLKSVYSQDGSHGVASLSAFHSLHCLKLVRRMVYKEHYHAGKSAKDMQRQMKHADHCIEYMRETLMCKPDISLVTFHWINDTAQHPDDPSGYYPTNFDASQHECFDWQALDDWAGARAFDLYNLSSLERPGAL